MTEFSFKNSPEWFTNYLVETHLDQLHDIVKGTDVMSQSNFFPKLLELAVEYFSNNGFVVDIRGQQLWFTIDETLPEVTYNALKWG